MVVWLYAGWHCCFTQRYPYTRSTLLAKCIRTQSKGEASVTEGIGSISWTEMERPQHARLSACCKPKWSFYDDWRCFLLSRENQGLQVTGCYFFLEWVKMPVQGMGASIWLSKGPSDTPAYGLSLPHVQPAQSTSWLVWTCLRLPEDSPAVQ